MKSFIIAVLMLTSLSVLAKNKISHQHACSQDIQKYCTVFVKAHKSVMPCLHANEQKVSRSCRAKMADTKKRMKKKFKSVILNCKADAQKLCKKIPAGKGGKLKCLREKRARLSHKCKAALP